MLLLFIMLAGIVVCLLCSYKKPFKSDIADILNIVLLTICMSVALVLCFIWIGKIFTEESARASNKVLYDSLLYQVENEVYENDIVKQKLYEKIIDWNTDLASYRKMTNNIFVGGLFYQYYYDFDFLPYPD